MKRRKPQKTKLPVDSNWWFTHRRDPRLEHLVGGWLIIIAVVLALWTVWLGASLPPDPLRQQWTTATWFGLDNYSLTWVGLDCIEVIGLAACGFLFRRAHPTARTIALLVIPVFCLDAWFDILTAISRSNLILSITMACGAELPMAAFLGWLAWKATYFVPANARSRS